MPPRIAMPPWGVFPAAISPRSTLPESPERATARRAVSSTGSPKSPTEKVKRSVLSRECAQHARQCLGQILGDQTRPEGSGGGAMKPNRAARRLECGHALREEPADETGENVAGARRRQRRRQIDADGCAPARFGDDGIRPFADDDRAQKRRGGARARQVGRKVQNFFVRFEQSCEFAIV